MRRLRHRVRVNVHNSNGEKTTVLKGTTLKLPGRLLRLLFGDMSEVMIIATGRTVDGIEIKEVDDPKGE